MRVEERRHIHLPVNQSQNGPEGFCLESSLHSYFILQDHKVWQAGKQVDMLNECLESLQVTQWSREETPIFSSPFYKAYLQNFPVRINFPNSDF